MLEVSTDIHYTDTKIMLRYALFMSQNILVQMYNETITGNDNFRELEYIYVQ